jgi:hypothetical protein
MLQLKLALLAKAGSAAVPSSVSHYQPLLGSRIMVCAGVCLLLFIHEIDCLRKEPPRAVRSIELSGYTFYSYHILLSSSLPGHTSLFVPSTFGNTSSGHVGNKL